MTAEIKSGLILSNGQTRQLPEYSIASGKGFGRIRTLRECIFAGQSTGVHTNGNTYTYDGVDFIAFRNDANGSSEITANGLKISRTASSVSPNSHGLYSPGDATNGGILYNTIGHSRFFRGNWQFWMRFYNLNIGSMTVTFTGAEVNGGYPYHGVSCRRYKSGLNAPASAGANAAVIYGPTNESQVTMTTSDTGYQGDVFCINMINPGLAEVFTGTWTGDWPTMNSMYFVGITNHFTGTNHSGTGGTTNTTFLRQFKLWQIHFFLGGTNVGDITIDRWRLTSFE